MGNISNQYGLLVGVGNSSGNVWMQAGRTDGLTNNYNIVLNASGGNILLGTNTDNGVAKLQVSGNITASGTITASSDARIKTNVRPLENSLIKVSKLNGIKYDRIDTDDKNQIGFIAQELEKEFPELVKTDKNEEGLKSINYQAMVAVLVESTKELLTKLEEQQTQINELKEEIIKLKNE